MAFMPIDPSSYNLASVGFYWGRFIATPLLPNASGKPPKADLGWVSLQKPWLFAPRADQSALERQTDLVSVVQMC